MHGNGQWRCPFGTIEIDPSLPTGRQKICFYRKQINNPSANADTIIVHCPPSIIPNVVFSVQDEIAFRTLPNAFFSSLDTWAWEMPISFATSIWVWPS